VRHYWNDPVIHWAARATLVEVARQDELWGEQNHPVHGGPRPIQWAAAEHKEEADRWKRRNDGRVESNTLGWDGILLEEVHEALAETAPEKQVEELIQVAAVALNMVASIHRGKVAL